MQVHPVGQWQHEHYFSLDAREGERRTRFVVILTAVMMVVEVAAGLLSGSMALLADGWHMGTHVAALGIERPASRVEIVELKPAVENRAARALTGSTAEIARQIAAILKEEARVI